MTSPLPEWDGDGMSIMPPARHADSRFATAERARMALAAAVAAHVVQGWRVESQTSNQAILVSGKNANHLLHFVISLFTCFLWAPMWLIIHLTTKEQRITLTLDYNGQVHRSTPATSY